MHQIEQLTPLLTLLNIQEWGSLAVVPDLLVVPSTWGGRLWCPSFNHYSMIVGIPKVTKYLITINDNNQQITKYDPIIMTQQKYNTVTNLELI
jgi:hypothetical protein